MVCIKQNLQDGGFGQLTQELNSIINQGYKLIEITNPSFDNPNELGGGLIGTYNSLNSYIAYGTVWYFAILEILVV